MQTAWLPSSVMIPGAREAVYTLIYIIFLHQSAREHGAADTQTPGRKRPGHPLRFAEAEAESQGGRAPS